MAHPDIPAEQAYLDHAYKCLERMRQALLRTVGAAGVGSEGADIAASRIEAWVDRRLVAYERAEEVLCFGRIDVESANDPLYVGRRWVDDDDGVVVVNWQAPAARPFYTATPAEPHGVTLRRRFRLQGRTLTGISDEALDGSLEDAASSLDDFLLEELERARDARMRDIVATIQADQYGLIARAPEPPLVIQGGPGTGKTAVGLHRASYLLFAHRQELRRVLLVGPNPVFMDYISHVLPALGEDAVDQRAVVELVEKAEVTLGETLGGLAVRAFDEVERSLRKDGVLTRFLENVWPAPKPEQVVRQLFASREHLAEAAEGILDEDEQRLLRRARSGWSAT